MKEHSDVQDVIVSTERHMANPRSPRYRSVQAERKPVSGVRSGTRTGTTSHFAAWKAEGAVKSALQRLKLDRLADAEDTPGVAAHAFAILFTSSRFKTVWSVARASETELLAVDGIGPARLKAIEEYLGARSVKLDWTAAA